MKPLYIFDLDGTLAFIEHRRHFVEGETKNWDAFFNACIDDKPNLPVMATLQCLSRACADIWIWSGRSDQCLNLTEAWLSRHGIYGLMEKLKMRKAGDHQPDEKLKASWYEALPLKDKLRLVGIFDDRQRVVDMWRSKGITCFQVAPGNF